MINFENRLKSLKNRRQGTRERAIVESMDLFSMGKALQDGSDIRATESFETLKETLGVKYAIGAMASVDSKSTELSIKEGNRVADSLIKSLTNQGEPVLSKLQGSVALDIHIKGYSDVDMLIIVRNTINTETPEIVPNNYLPSTDHRSLIEIIRDVRNKSENILSRNFPKVDVDCSGNKSIALCGGSLLRKVDIVPAIWYDSLQYQHSREEHDRGIKIYHKSDHGFILNYPFTHIKKVNDQDSHYAGNLKCVIRLMKNMIADMPDYKKCIANKLSSYDLASIGYHMNNNLSLPYYMRLGLVEKIRAHLDLLLCVESYRNSLNVPDGSRKIFDDNRKVDALEILTNEFGDLAVSIFKELRPLQGNYDSSVLINKVIA